jgi:Ca2+-binding RTX toxin-like protein
VILGLAGTTRSTGWAAGDVICGGTGNDFIVGGEGNDQVDGGAANDRLRGGTGDDALIGGDGWDRVSFDAGDRSIYANLATGVAIGQGYAR